MSDRLNIWTANLEQMLELTKSGSKETVDRVVRYAAQWGHFDDLSEASEPWLYKAVRGVILDGDWGCPQHEWACYGLMMLCEHELVADEWDRELYQRVGEAAPNWGLSTQACALLGFISSGRTPQGGSTEPDPDNHVACFIRGQEAQALVEELLGSETLRNLDEPEIYDTLFDHLVPALDREIPSTHAFLFL